MKTKLLQFTTLVLVLAGSFSSCGKEDDIDMSKIDFSNIENMDEQPLPVIKKCVEGKWEWCDSYGGSIVLRRYENTFVEIHEDHVMINYEDGSQLSFDVTWKRGEKTHYLWDKERNQSVWFFLSIRNDTLSCSSYSSYFIPGIVSESMRNDSLISSSNPSSFTDMGHGFVSNVIFHRLVRIK